MRTRYFYLNNGDIKVDLMDVTRLANFATKLEPIPSDSKVAGYYLALREHMNKNRDNLLFNCYNLLTSDIKGVELLYSNIHFYLFNKIFMEERPSNEDIMAFNVVVNDYHRILSENMETYKNKFEKKPKSRR